MLQEKWTDRWICIETDEMKMKVEMKKLGRTCKDLNQVSLGTKLCELFGPLQDNEKDEIQENMIIFWQIEKH